MTNTEIAQATNIMFGTTQVSAMYLGSTLLWQQQTQPTSRLPQGYTEVEYISSTQRGSQYIDLGIKLYETSSPSYDIAIKFNIKGAGSDNNQPTLFGCQNTTSPWPGTFIRMNQNTATSVTGRFIGANVKDNYLGNINTVIELPQQTSPDKNVYSYNNSGQTHSFGTSLFCIFSDANNTPAKFIEADLYYFKLLDPGAREPLVRDMVPCIDPNNVVGLYDLVNNTFYSSPNGAAFVAGPAV